MNVLAERRNVLLGVTGSIAAYKSVELARLLVSRGYPVKVIMTTAATKFVTPLTFEAITGAPVITAFWEKGKSGDSTLGIDHIELADWAHVVAIVPASADIIAKIAAGFCENPLQAAVLATKAPVVIAPAMNVNMLSNSQTQANLKALRSREMLIVNPEEGALACGWTGAGRLADPQEIFREIRRALTRQDYHGKRVLITTGPTREAIDPVRFISNRSSGKMGAALAHEAHRRGADVTVVHGPMRATLSKLITTVPVTSAAEMSAAVQSLVFDKDPQFDIIIMAAAVADFMPETPEAQKIKHGQIHQIALRENVDILATLGARRGDTHRPTLVGFAVETGDLNELLEELQRKLQSKRADLMIGNLAAEAFDLDTNRVWIVNKHGKREEVATTFKSRVANKILDAVLKV